MNSFVRDGSVLPQVSRSGKLLRTNDSGDLFMIDVQKIDEQTFEVTVSSGTTTTHRVTVSADDYQRLAGGRASAEMLVRKSFEFLLAREPNTSILSTFDLSVIGRYFPEFERTVPAMLE